MSKRLHRDIPAYRQRHDPYDVTHTDFFVYFPDLTRALRCTETLVEIGCGYQLLRFSNGEALVIATQLGLADMPKWDMLFRQFADMVGGDYDGWEYTIMKDASPEELAQVRHAMEDQFGSAEELDSLLASAGAA